MIRRGGGGRAETRPAAGQRRGSWRKENATTTHEDEDREQRNRPVQRELEGRIESDKVDLWHVPAELLGALPCLGR